MVRESAEGEVRYGKVVAYRVQPTEGAGFIAILTQLGIPMPTS